MNNANKLSYFKLATMMFFIIVAWFLFDRFTKIYFDSGQFYLGQAISDSFFGIFHFTLVHNKGAAFGMLSNMTIFLAIISIIVSLALLCFPFYHLFLIKKNRSQLQLNLISIISLSLIISGGLGNAVDRLVNGFVVDFICFDFIDFPVFNIADIGVTCGIVILIISMLINSKNFKK